jgi:membrane protease YdiL (CAAX protease family)
MVRGNTFRWWRPLLVFLLCAVFGFFAQIVLAIVAVVIKIAMGGDPLDFVDALALTGPMDALTFGYVAAGLASLIPAAMFASWIVHGVRPRFLTSVAGGFRWGWLLRCLVITGPIFAIYLGINFLLGWDYGPKPPQWIALLILVVIGIPFQSAGEEYVFRGIILQNVGGWIRRPLVAVIVASVPAVLLFAFAHGGFDPWVLADLSVFALGACVVTWRTGGLEAAIALHATNNVLLMISTILFGGWAGAFVTESTQGSPLSVLGTLAVQGVSVALILWQAKRLGIQRTFQPVAAQPAVAAG